MGLPGTSGQGYSRTHEAKYDYLIIVHIGPGGHSIVMKKASMKVTKPETGPHDSVSDRCVVCFFSPNLRGLFCPEQLPFTHFRYMPGADG